MRMPVTPNSKHRTFSISFPPALKNAARKRAHHLELTLSAYMQRLVEADIASRKSPAPLDPCCAANGGARR
jgi:hypothetical protein